jgi:hypothetical protein
MVLVPFMSKPMNDFDWEWLAAYYRQWLTDMTAGDMLDARSSRPGRLI